MYSKPKRILSLIAGIFAIVMGGLSSLAALFTFFASLYDPAVVVLAMFNTGFGVTMIIFGCKLCKAPIQENGVWRDPKPSRIALIAIEGASVFYFFWAMIISLVCAIGDAEGLLIVAFLFDYLALLLFFEALPLCIVAMCLPAVRGIRSGAPVYTPAPAVLPAPTAPSSPAAPVTPIAEPDGLDTKIARLKAWRAEGVITEEQYSAAIQKLLDNIVD